MNIGFIKKNEYRIWFFARNGEKWEYHKSLSETIFGHNKPNTIKRMPDYSFSFLCGFHNKKKQFNFLKLIFV